MTSNISLINQELIEKSYNALIADPEQIIQPRLDRLSHTITNEDIAAALTP